MIGSGVAVSAVATGMFQDGQRQPVCCLYFYAIKTKQRGRDSTEQRLQQVLAVWSCEMLG